MVKYNEIKIESQMTPTICDIPSESVWLDEVWIDISYPPYTCRDLLDIILE